MYIFSKALEKRLQGKQRPLMEIAKDDDCFAEEFLARARSHPEELALTETADAKVIKRRKSMFNISPKEVEEDDSIETGSDLTPVHHFMKNCGDLEVSHIQELRELDEECFKRVTSKNRTPVHWLFAFNARIRPKVPGALRQASEDALVVRDEEG